MIEIPRAPETGTHSRRALIAGALGAGLATIAAALGRPVPARAADPNDVVLGVINGAGTTTTITMDIPGAHLTAFSGQGVFGTGVAGVSSGGIGVSGTGHHTGVKATTSATSDQAFGVYAETDSTAGYGVFGFATASSGNTVGVAGRTDSPTGTAMLAHSTAGAGGSRAAVAQADSTSGIGVYGYTPNGTAASRGVTGESPGGQGVRGVSTSGIGVRGFAASGVAGSFETTSGLALSTKGRVRFSQIVGIASLASGASSVTVTPGVDLTVNTAVLATLNGNPGAGTTIHRVSINTTANSFTVHLTGSSSAAIKIAWFVLEQ